MKDRSVQSAFASFAKVILGIAAIAAMTCLSSNAYAQKKGQNGTTLATYKTIDICRYYDSAGNEKWRISGEIAIWNEGALDTVGLNVVDTLQKKGVGSNWDTVASQNLTAMFGVIPAGTTQLTALTAAYEYNDVDPISVDIRNVVDVTILNHSGYLGIPFGPQARATYTGALPPPLCGPSGCTYTQGYWGNKPDVVWPAPYARDASFFLSGQTCQQVMDTPVNASPGYYQLAHQYLAAVLNQANGAPVPSGVQDTLDLAFAWLSANGPSACTAKGSCGIQKDWAAILDLYNNGLYVGGPPHCGDEVLP